MFMRARGASELENFGIFTFQKCYFFQYFVGTSDILSVQLICLSANMYRQISKCTDKTPKKHYWGGGGSCPPAPPPPPLATLVTAMTSGTSVSILSVPVLVGFFLIRHGSKHGKAD